MVILITAVAILLLNINTNCPYKENYDSINNEESIDINISDENNNYDEDVIYKLKRIWSKF